MTTPDDRVTLWNTFMKMALMDAQALHVGKGGAPDPRVDKFPTVGELLSDQEMSALGMVTNCCIAIEARTKHLAEELLEAKRLQPHEAKALQKLNAVGRWFLLPRIAANKSFDPAKPPHLAVVQLWNIRNHVMHCNFEALGLALKDISKPEIAGQFGLAMLELNDAVRGTAPDDAGKALFKDLLVP